MSGEKKKTQTAAREKSPHPAYLAGVDDVNQPIALLLLDAVADARQVGRVVGEACMQ